MQPKAEGAGHVWLTAGAAGVVFASTSQMVQTTQNGAKLEEKGGRIRTNEANLGNCTETRLRPLAEFALVSNSEGCVATRPSSVCAAAPGEILQPVPTGENPNRSNGFLPQKVKDLSS